MVRFSELEYKRPDFAYIKKKLRHHIDTIARASSYSEAKAAFLRFNTVFENAATMIVTARIRHDVNTADPFYEAETKWLEKQLVLLAPLLKKLNKAMTASRYAADFAADYGELLLRDMEAQLRTQNNRILLLMIRENELVRAYSKLAAGCRTDFRGESCNFYGLLRHMQSPDRSERREAFEAWRRSMRGSRRSSISFIPGWWRCASRRRGGWAFPAIPSLPISRAAGMITAPTRYAASVRQCATV